VNVMIMIPRSGVGDTRAGDVGVVDVVGVGVLAGVAVVVPLDGVAVDRGVGVAVGSRVAMTGVGNAVPIVVVCVVSMTASDSKVGLASTTTATGVSSG